jgi:hypothetical protein
MTNNVKAPGSSSDKEGVVGAGNIGATFQIGFYFQGKPEISSVLIG